LILPLDSQAKNYFRIVTNSGKTLIKETLTPEEAQAGYDIISESGRLIKIVAPALSEEDYALMSESQKLELQQKKKAEEEAQYNLNLLLKYTSIEDLQAERRRKLGEFDSNINILRGNLSVLRENSERQRARAATIERNDSAIPQKLKENIQDIEREMNETSASIVTREKEKQAASLKYDKDAERLQLLLDKKFKG